MIAAALGSAALVAVSVKSLADGLLHMPSGRLHGQIWAGVDFHTYLAAAIVGLRHGCTEIYDQDLVRATQEHIAPAQYTQPFLSPPLDAWVVAPLEHAPSYALALVAWTLILVAAFVLALGWSSDHRGPARIAAVALALTPWWVLVAIYVGQVVILVAAAVLVGWRLMRSNHETAAGLVLALVLLKPNTAILVPFVLLMAGRWRTFAVFAGTSVVAVGASYLIVGPEGASDYLDSLTRLPGGASALTLYGTFGITGALATLTRGAILVGAVAGAYLSR